MRILRKNPGAENLTYAQALDEALCFGWIDGQKRSYDDTSWLQRFVRRRKGSRWSKVNRQHAERLTAEGRMAAPGLEAVDRAKSDGRWAAAYDSMKTSTVPSDFAEALAKNATAQGFFEKLDRANVYAILYRLQHTTRVELRAKKVAQFVEMLERGEKIHP